MKATKLFITGIDTEVGKTIVSAYFTSLLQADYWKPIQSGDLHYTDSMKIKELTPNNTVIYPERYALKLAASPHQSAAAEHIDMKVADFELPYTSNNMIVEGAGGLFVPINESEYIIDLIAHLQLPVVLVSKNYLGCINHTLLSIEALQSRHITIDYFVFNGDFNPHSKAAIQAFLSPHTQIIDLPQLDTVTKESIAAAVLHSILN